MRSTCATLAELEEELDGGSETFAVPNGEEVEVELAQVGMRWQDGSQVLVDGRAVVRLVATREVASIGGRWCRKFLNADRETARWTGEEIWLRDIREDRDEGT